MATSRIQMIRVQKVTVSSANDAPSSTEIYNGIKEAYEKYGNGFVIIDLVRETLPRSSCIMSLVNDYYGAGICISYYTAPRIQLVVLSGGTVTLSSI